MDDPLYPWPQKLIFYEKRINAALPTTTLEMSKRILPADKKESKIKRKQLLHLGMGINWLACITTK